MLRTPTRVILPVLILKYDVNMYMYIYIYMEALRSVAKKIGDNKMSVLMSLPLFSSHSDGVTVCR